MQASSYVVCIMSTISLQKLDKGDNELADSALEVPESSYELMCDQNMFIHFFSQILFLDIFS